MTRAHLTTLLQVSSPVSEELYRLLVHDVINLILLHALAGALRTTTAQSISKTHGLHLTFRIHPDPPNDCPSSKFLLETAEIKPLRDLSRLPNVKNLAFEKAAI